MFSEDEKYMYRCLELAKAGREYASPNPMVGAVIVVDGKIIGEGYHRCCGQAHAEVNAIASVKDTSLLCHSTLYVNLEPCSHYGKTPPCAELIIKKGIPRVVIGCLDPYPEVAGRGVRMLREAGVDVLTGCLEKESKALNQKFITAHTAGRPYILLKWAQSQDGFIDKHRIDASQAGVVFSSSLSSQEVHKLRAEYDAILVGTRTALLDNPSLTVRNWSGQSPVRVVIDKDLLIPEDFHLLDGNVKTFIFTKYKRENRNNVEYIPVDFNDGMLSQMLSFLLQQGINSLIVEGGTNLLSQFLEKKLWDEIRVETAPVCLHTGVKSPELPANTYKISSNCGETDNIITFYKPLNSF